MKSPDYQRGSEDKRREFKQHLNDCQPDKPLNRKQQEQMREVVHEHRKLTER